MRVTAAGSRRRAAARSAEVSPTLDTASRSPPNPSTPPPDYLQFLHLASPEAIPWAGHRPGRLSLLARHRIAAGVHRKNLPLEIGTQAAAECHRCNYDRE